MKSDKFLLFTTIVLLNQVFENIAILSNRTEPMNIDLLANDTQLHQLTTRSNESIAMNNLNVNQTIIYVYPQTTTKSYKDIVIIYPVPTTIKPKENYVVIESVRQSVDTTTIKSEENDLITEGINQNDETTTIKMAENAAITESAIDTTTVKIIKKDIVMVNDSQIINTTTINTIKNDSITTIINQSIDITTTKPVEKFNITNANQRIEEKLFNGKILENAEPTNSTMISNDTSKVMKIKNVNQSNQYVNNLTNTSQTTKAKFINYLSPYHENGIAAKYIKNNHVEQKNITNITENTLNLEKKTINSNRYVTNHKKMMETVKKRISPDYSKTKKLNATTDDDNIEDLSVAASNDDFNPAIALPPTGINYHIRKNIQMIHFTSDDAIFPNKKKQNNDLNNPIKIFNNNFKSYEKHISKPEKINENLNNKITINPKKYDDRHYLKKSFYPKTYHMREKYNSDNAKFVQNALPLNSMSMWSGYMQKGQPISRTSNMSPQIRQRNNTSFLQIDTNLTKDLLVVGPIPKQLVLVL